jgi:hypothetical protein
MIIKYYKRYKPFLQNIKGIEPLTEIQNFKIKQSVLMIVLYTYVYNQIPSTNPRALELIDYYFFKNPVTFKEKITIREYDDVNDLTYISLFLNTDSLSKIPDQFYSGEVLQQSLDIDTKIINEISTIINDINSNIEKISDYRKLFRLIIAYIFTFFAICLCLLMLYLYIIIRYSDSNDTDKTIINMSKNIYEGIKTALNYLK